MGFLLVFGPIEWVFWSLCMTSAAGALLLMAAETRIWLGKRALAAE